MRNVSRPSVCCKPLGTGYMLPFFFLWVFAPDFNLANVRKWSFLRILRRRRIKTGTSIPNFRDSRATHCRTLLAPALSHQDPRMENFYEFSSARCGKSRSTALVVAVEDMLMLTPRPKPITWLNKQEQTHHRIVLNVIGGNRKKTE